MAQQQTSANGKRRETPYVKRYREFWFAERTAAWLYRQLAEIADEDSAKTLHRLAQAEDIHAGHWEQLLERSGVTNLRFTRPPWRERVLARIARRFGLETVLPILVRLEAADASKYVGDPDAPTSMSEEEVQHGRSLAMIGSGSPGRIADIESRHRVKSGGVLRAATFGVNDGLVSNLSLVMGVAGGSSGNSEVILLAGVAGLLAGAFSMAAGEWVSVRSQRELYEREIEIEREELATFPEEERDELAMIYRAKGIEPEAAARLAERIMLRPSAALDTLAREELGLDPGDLASPWAAAISSFLAFAVGAFVPVLPFLVTTGAGALLGAALASGVVLAFVGLGISLLTGKSPLVSAARMLVVGAIAAGVTYGVGSLVGTSIA
ncbi:MAG TPA: VIT1/CCC1 transporter family protein [Actinomycetota bacterium]|nr:VIT1/CCC1 transporter family protein [Actinomycetota bacterium]